MLSSITIVAFAILGYAYSATVEVQVEQGTLLGQELELSTGDGTFYSFKGIPYAKPPTGSLRFKAPEDPESWEGVKNATAHGSNCPQWDILNQVLVPGSEDCLFLNVYTPEITPETPLPVMFFIHGGGFEFLSGDDTYFGPDFIVGKDVILVTINYRLSALGFLSLDTEEVPGNAGLKDQVAALKWVNQNIASFGGNPNNVTIFGQSAGAASVSLFLLSPLASGLFNRAILLSGSLLDEWVQPFEPRRRAFALGKALGINTTDTTELLDYLRSLPAEDIVGHYINLNAMESKANIFGKMFPWGPVVEKDFGQDRFLTEEPTTSLANGNVVNDVDLMFGHGSQEMVFAIEYFFNDFIPLFQEWPELFVPRNILNVADQKTILDLSYMIQQHYFGNETLSWETVPQFTQYLSDANFVNEIIRFVENLPFGNHSRYAYRFACQSERNLFGNLGAAYNVTGFSHGDDFFYVFDARAASSLPLNKTSTTYTMVDNIVTTVTNFAKYGNPTPDDSLGAEWPEYNLETRSYAEFTEEITVGTDLDAELQEFWQSVYEFVNLDYYLQTN